MISLLPLAGQSSRFAAAGMRGHKALLPIPGGRTVLARVMDDLPPGKLLVIARAIDEPFLRFPILDGASAMRDKVRLSVMMQWIHRNTASPAESMYQLHHRLTTTDEVLIAYCDCWLEGGLAGFLAAARASAKTAAFVVFRTNDRRFGQWKSGFGFGGIAWFREATTLRNRLYAILRLGRGGEPGLPELYQSGRAGHIYLAEDYVDVGTPEAYRAYLSAHG